MTSKPHTNPLSLLPYQQRWVVEKTLLNVAAKCRCTGLNTAAKKVRELRLRSTQGNAA